MNEKKQTIIYVVISIGLLLAAVVGATFAYFTAQRGEGANINITSTSGTTDSLTFRTEGTINIEANQENFGQEHGSNQQASAKAIANLIASDAKEATYTYNVYLKIEENELTYTKDESTPELVISIKNPDGTWLDKLDGFAKTTQVKIEGDESQVETVTGFDITKYKGLIPIAEDETITATAGATSEETWEVYVTLIYLEEDNQNENTGKQVSGTLIIQKDKMTSTSTGGSPLDTLLAASEISKEQTTQACSNGIGGLIKHDKEGTEEPNGAKDDGYRYSGCNPNNFICFGAGSEQYNSGTGTCLPANQYRIIGIVPVTKSDGSQEQLVKVIKSEYITASELGKTAKDGTPYFNSSYTGLARVQADVTNLDGFYWNLSSNKWTDGNWNYWSKDNGDETPQIATLNKSLNDEDEGYLSKLKNSSDGIDWSEKIETVQWNVGGVNTYSVTPKAMKEAEENQDKGRSITSKAKIGLMYVHDYGFASGKDNWGKNLYCDSQNDTTCYWGDTNRNNNWLFNGVFEWTISRYSGVSDRAFYVNRSGYVYYDYVGSNSLGVRPVFYLKSNVEIKSDGADGSSEHPFRVQ